MTSIISCITALRHSSWGTASWKIDLRFLTEGVEWTQSPVWCYLQNISCRLLNLNQAGIYAYIFSFQTSLETAWCTASSTPLSIIKINIGECELKQLMCLHASVTSMGKGRQKAFSNHCNRVLQRLPEFWG